MQKLTPSLLLLVSTCTGHSVMAQTAGPEGQPDGLQVYSVSASSTYYTNALGSMTTSASAIGTQLRADVGSGGSIALGGRHHHGKFEAWVNYSASYLMMARYRDWRPFSEFLNLGATRQLGGHWSLTLSGAGADSTAMEFLLNPAALSSVGSQPTADDLMAGAVNGTNGNLRVESALNGAPFLNSPTQTLLFGQRILAYTLDSRLTWNKSSRLSLYFGGLSGGGYHVSQRSRADGLPDSRYTNPHSMTVNAGVGVNYSITPRTQIGVNVTGQRTSSSSANLNAYFSTATASLSRRMGRDWFLSLSGGAGKMWPEARGGSMPATLQVMGSGQVGYQKRAHTFSAAYMRTLSDSYGFGAGLTTSATGTWTWARAGARWQLMATGGRQQVKQQAYGNTIDGWLLSSGISRTLSHRTVMQAQYAYLKNTATYLPAGMEYSLHTVRVSFTWAPQMMLLRF